MDVHVTFGVIFTTVAFSAALLGVGFLLGKLAQPPEDQAVSKQLTEMTQCWTQLASVERQALHLSELAQYTSLPGELMLAISRVVNSIQLIEQRLSKTVGAPLVSVACTPPQSSNPRTLDGDAAYTDLIARNLEKISQMTTSSKPLASFDPARPYNRPASVAPWVEGSFPQASQFVPVQCQRLSADGLLFDAQEEPMTKRLVVKLGDVDSSVYLLAEVDNHRTAIVEGTPFCRVQLRFLARINPPPLPFDSPTPAVVA